MYSCQWFKDIFTDYVRNLAQHLAFNRIRVAVAIKKLHPYTTNQKKKCVDFEECQKHEIYTV